jgi:hypothetical protein
LKVLVSCEFSGVVREAFRNRGHDAWSCDILPSLDNSKYHIQDDVLNHLKDGWGLMIAHPPCTFMCNSGVSHLYKDDSRWDRLREAKEFFYKLWKSNIEMICIENPIPHKYAELPKYTQLIQPYEFGHTERKATCLWLKNLPKIKPTRNVKEEMLKLPKNQSQRIHYMPPGKNRGLERSITFKGVADAMADQWGMLLTVGEESK